ncbi:recombinase family protein [Clostridium paraputrificum]|uniref:recombinase family protein n=1 Tax=Clostridium paraputrificum TaxID=29363 RepID=UPI00189B05F0|nr:recombinase family protein [Clostridium paraputrificum]MDB2123794.1 recombinase family protein [Clostridium paraputrificum]
MNKVFGYCRVSNKDQQISRQIKILKEEGIDERDIFIDKLSGKDMNRDQYQLLKKIVRKDDTIVFTECDRLGRNMDDIKRELEWFKNNDVNIKILDLPILNSSGLEGKLIQSILIELYSYLAEKERLKIKSRQRQGIDIAKKDPSKYKGRVPKKLDGFDEIKALIDSKQISVSEGCRRLGINNSTYYRRIKNC